MGTNKGPPVGEGAALALGLVLALAAGVIELPLPGPALLGALLGEHAATPDVASKARAANVPRSIMILRIAPPARTGQDIIWREPEAEQGKTSRAKQAPGWQLTQDQPGVITWRLPSGRTYASPSDPYPV